MQFLQSQRAVRLAPWRYRRALRQLQRMRGMAGLPPAMPSTLLRDLRGALENARRAADRTLIAPLYGGVLAARTSAYPDYQSIRTLDFVLHGETLLDEIGRVGVVANLAWRAFRQVDPSVGLPAGIPAARGVYVFWDPQRGAKRYVGIAQDLRRRLGEHLVAARRLGIRRLLVHAAPVATTITPEQLRTIEHALVRAYGHNAITNRSPRSPFIALGAIEVNVPPGDNRARNARISGAGVFTLKAGDNSLEAPTPW